MQQLLAEPGVRAFLRYAFDEPRPGPVDLAARERRMRKRLMGRQRRH
jgi:hypothetical protein